HPAAAAPGAGDPQGGESPLDGCELQTSKEKFHVSRHSDHKVFGPFPSTGLTCDKVCNRFSPDDHWLAMWGDGRIQVLDLNAGEIAFELNLSSINDVDFAGANMLLKVNTSRGSMLVPLDARLLERFTDWLAARTLSSPERCMYGFGGN